MERTQAKTGQRDAQAPPVVGTLGQVVRAGRTAGTPIPVATVVSVFDDLLAGEADPAGARRPDLDDVLIDQAGVARLDIAADLRSLANLLVETLGDDVPDPGRSFIERLKSEAPDDQPADAAQLRGWMRDALGQPADRTEVIALVKSVASPLPVPEAVNSETPEREASAPDASPAPAPIPDLSQTIYDVRADVMAEGAMSSAKASMARCAGDDLRPAFAARGRRTGRCRFGLDQRRGDAGRFDPAGGRRSAARGRRLTVRSARGGGERIVRHSRAGGARRRRCAGR